MKRKIEIKAKHANYLLGITACVEADKEILTQDEVAELIFKVQDKLTDMLRHELGFHFSKIRIE